MYRIREFVRTVCRFPALVLTLSLPRKVRANVFGKMTSILLFFGATYVIKSRLGVGASLYS